MSPVQIVFLLTAIVTLGSALMVVTDRNLIHAAFWLILTLFGVAVFFVLLNAGFLAVAQVVIYIGAISVLMIFAIMLTRRLAIEPGSQTNHNWGWAALIAVVLFGGLAWMLSSWQGFSTPMPALSPEANPLVRLGEALVSPNAYVLPFEVASVLLLAALVGAIMVAWERK
jgi:NADH-quinone oxidoreductase subunit J